MGGQGGGDFLNFYSSTAVLQLIQERDRLRKNLETDLMDLAHFREEIEALEQQQQRR